jgi:hypothetical protein
MLIKRISIIDAGDVSKRKGSKIRKFGEGGLLQGGNFCVMYLRHVVVCQWIASLFADFKSGVEFQHLQELNIFIFFIVSLELSQTSKRTIC